MRQSDRGLQRIADGVAEPAVAGEPLGNLRHALRMDEQRHAQFLGLGPHRMELGVGEFHAGDRAADRGALQPLLLHRGLELLHGEVGRLQGERGEGGEAVGLGSAELGQLLVLQLDDLPGELAVAAVPEGVDRQHLHVDGLPSIAFSRLSISMKASAAPLTGGNCTAAASAPSNAPASRKWQWACTSMVLTFLPLTATGRVRDVPCACALSSRPQLQKTIPVAAAVPPLRKFRRVVMRRPSEDCPASCRCVAEFRPAGPSVERTDGDQRDMQFCQGAEDRPGVTPP